MRYFIDSEFIDDGEMIDLISIGIVCDDGREHYAQCSDFISSNANEWVKENVFPHLYVCQDKWDTSKPSYPNEHHFGIGNCRDVHCPWRTRAQIRDEVLAFVRAGEGNPEFIGWVSAYDHVALCQLFGTMMDLPPGFPHYTRDLQHILDDKGILDEDLPPQDGTAHNALEDARHIKRLWDLLQFPFDVTDYKTV